MNETHLIVIAKELDVDPDQVRAAAGLLGEGATVPFIARYRKEATRSLDEVAITTIRDRLGQLEELDVRRESILNSLKERELLTDELKDKILRAESMSVLEDIYLPYRPKRRTRATMAREKGLEPLALLLLAQDAETKPMSEASRFIDPEKGVETVEDALAGARDIVAELANEDEKARSRMRDLFASKGVFRSKVIAGKETEGAKFKDYFDWEEPVASAPSHRVLAMRRRAAENVLILRVAAPEDEALAVREGLFVLGDCDASNEVRKALQDSYKRLLGPAMETEIRLESKKRADEAAIKVFAENIRELLMAPPLGQKNVLAMDPGFRTGCKLVCLDRQGKLLHSETIFPLLSNAQRSEAEKAVLRLCKEFDIEAIAVGNGTGGRETESFVRGIGLAANIAVVMVNESGASVYSASKLAREEMPDKDVTVRGAASIGRRLMDPLSELVKIDPKSIGVGQYQHDVDQKGLKRSLDDVVISCVNAVGVDVNTASPSILTYVSGLGPGLARNIVSYRDKNGPFVSREALKGVPMLGPKAFEQSAGFLRIPDGSNPLDRSAVHPESYPIVQAMAGDLNCSIIDLLHNEEHRKRIEIARYVTDSVGVPTLTDIMKELAKPGRDPRDRFESFAFSDKVEKLEDLEPGMTIPGIVTNVTAFGAFVDIGVHQDGLVHVSQLADRFVKNPHEVVKVHQAVRVTVLEVDPERRRIALSMRQSPLPENTSSHKKAEQRGSKGKQVPRQNTKVESAGFNTPFANLLKNN
ncbi:MAG: RNA-binding transcriptional accessory protein [Deltaproteobacteria bacterium]|nr:RNA-binding transcriptional accessory protein [Deltaproteobacteria bacterium]